VEQLHWVPAKAVERVTLAGATVRVEPVDPSRHGHLLFEASHGAAGDPHIWDHLAYGPFADADVFMSWLEERAASEDPVFFTIVDQATGLPRGMASLMRIVPEHGVIEVGHIWFAPVLQRTRQATEAIFLMARYAFDGLGYRRLEWKCDSLNQPSRRAAERFGFTYEGVFRQHMVTKGRNRDTAWYSIVDGEWPRVRAAFEAWLDPANFDSSGRQHLSLSEIRDKLTL
jgi:RimJ/RimL family protein N-acetyltransferase